MAGKGKKHSVTAAGTRAVWLAGNSAWHLFNFRAGLIRGLLADGIAVTVCCPADAYIERLKQMGVAHVPLRLAPAGINPLKELATLLHIWRLLKSHRPQAVLTFTPKVNIYFCLAASVTGIPALANVSGLGRAFTKGGWLELVARNLYRLAFRAANTVFFQNRDDQILFVQSGLVERNRCGLLPGSGIDLQRFAPAPGSARQVGPFRFLLVGRMLWDKGVGEYVAAARLLAAGTVPVQCGLLGFVDVENPAAISRAQIAAWQAEGVVQYFDATDDVRTQLTKTDCVVLPSYREGTPRSLLEAAAMGIPVIATDAVGCREVVDDGVTGFLCRLKDGQDLAEKMARMLGLGETARAEMGRRGREKMEREFDQALIVRAYLDCLRPLLPVHSV